MTSTMRIRELARELGQLRTEFRASVSTAQLGSSSIEGGGSIIIRDGDTDVLQVGGQWDGTYTAAPLSGPTPPIPSKPILSALPGALLAQWDGTWTDSIFAPMDFSRVEVHLGTTADFDASFAESLRGTIETPRGADVIISDLAAGTYWVKLVCRSSPGSRGPESTGASVTVEQAVTVGDVQTVAERVEEAFLAADGKARIYRQTTPPNEASNPPPISGDVWFDSDQGNMMSVHNGTVWVPTKYGTEALGTGIITADLLVSNLVLASTISAGNLNEAHTEMNPSGLAFYGPGADGGVVQTSRMGSNEGTDFLSILDPVTGSTTVSLSQAGGISALSASLGSAPGSVSVMGRRFEDYFLDQPRGMVDHGRRIVNGSLVSANTNTPFLEVQTTLDSGRSYLIESSNIYMYNDTANGRSLLFLYFAASGDAVTTTSTPLDSVRSVQPIAQTVKVVGPKAYVRIPPNADDTVTSTEYRFLVSYSSELGSVQALAASSYPVTLTVTDVGPYVPDVGIDRSGGGGSAATKKNYITYWHGTTTGSYKGDGTKRTDTTDAMQGYNSSNGNQFSMTVFNGGAVQSNYSEDVGKTIAVALSGATVTAVYGYYYFHHWYYNAGGTALIGVSAATSIPGALSATSHSVSSAEWPKPGGRWIKLPTLSNIRATTLGQPPSTSLTYYGRAYGAGTSNRPQLRFHYTR